LARRASRCHVVSSLSLVDRSRWGGWSASKPQYLGRETTMWSAWADFYGAVGPAKKGRAPNPTAETFFVGLGTCLASLSFTLLLCAHMSFRQPYAVDFICIGLYFVFVVPLLRHRRGLWNLTLGFAGLCGVFSGTFWGAICYRNFGYFVQRYSKSRIYPSVDPYQGADSVADGALLVFAKEARVATDKSGGFLGADGVLYCVAPILGYDEPEHIEFWAVGVDCCKLSGNFTCDSAADTAARGGAIVFGGPGSKGGGPFGPIFAAIFGQSGFSSADADAAMKEKFQPAIKKVEAQFSLPSSSGGDPTLVRWMLVDNLKQLSRDHLLSAWLFSLLAALFCILTSAPCIWLAARRSVQSFHRRQDFWGSTPRLG